MPLGNTTQRYGSVAITLHWLMAIAILAMFGVGLWMSSLGYLHEWYKTAPQLHKSTGMILMGLLLLRLLWRLGNPPPPPAPSHKPWEIKAAALTHRLLYLLMFATMVAGYLISTADGRAIAVFNWFEVPALISDLPEQEDVAGEAHELLAWCLIALAALHVLAGLKHHFIDRDNTLKKMLGRN